MAITYLTSINTQAPASPIRQSRIGMGPLASLSMQVAPPRWRPLNYSAPKTQARTVCVSRTLALRALTFLKMAVFWRGSNALPLKGQRYPLSR